MTTLAHAGHWLFALPAPTVVAGLALMVLVERRRDRHAPASDERPAPPGRGSSATGRVRQPSR